MSSRRRLSVGFKNESNSNNSSEEKPRKSLSRKLVSNPRIQSESSPPRDYISCSKRKIATRYRDNVDPNNDTKNKLIRIVEYEYEG